MPITLSLFPLSQMDFSCGTHAPIHVGSRDTSVWGSTDLSQGGFTEPPDYDSCIFSDDEIDVRFSSDDDDIHYATRVMRVFCDVDDLEKPLRADSFSEKDYLEDGHSESSWTISSLHDDEYLTKAVEAEYESETDSEFTNVTPMSSFTEFLDTSTTSSDLASLLAWADAYVAEREGAKVIDLVEISHLILDTMIADVINQ